MISKKTLKIGLISATLVTICALFWVFKAPSWLDKHIQKQLINNGFVISNIENTEKRIGAIRYNNIQLDTQEQSSIQQLTIKYDPLNWKNIKSISIDNMFLSGEIDVDKTLQITGIEKIDLPALIKTIPAKSITAKNVNISILSAHLGGIRGTINASATMQNDNQIWTGNITTKQDQFELIAKFNAQYNQSGAWFGELEVENTKLERSDLKLTRVNGMVEFKGINNQWRETNTNLTAGGMFLYNTPWQNTSINVTKTPAITDTIISAKSAGAENLELSVEHKNTSDKTNTPQWNASIHAENGAQLLNYLKNAGLMPLQIRNLKQFSNKTNLKLNIKPQQKSLIFHIKEQNQDIDTKGIIKPKESDTFSIVLAMKNNMLNNIKQAKCRAIEAIDQTICQLNVKHDAGAYNLINQAK